MASNRWIARGACVSGLAIVPCIVACIGDNAGGPTSGSSSGGGGSGSSGQPAQSSSSSGEPGTSSSSSGEAPQDAGSDAAPPGFRDLPGLSLWLEADDLAVNGPAAFWTDRSPLHNDATAVELVPQVVGGNDSVSGHHAVRFTGGQGLRIDDDASLQFDAEGFLIEIVERHPGIVDNASEVLEPLFHKTTTDGLRFAFGYRGSGDHPAFYRGDLGGGDAGGVRWPALLPPNNAGLAANVPHLVTLRLRPGGQLTVRGDNEAPVTVSVVLPTDGGLAAIGVPAFLGARPEGPPLAADIAAVIIVRAPTDDVATQVDTYLRTQYGFAAP